MTDDAPRRYRYVGLAMPERKGQECEVLATSDGRGKRTALVRFADGGVVTVSARTLRRIRP